MEDLYIELLKYFNDVPIGKTKNISQFILMHFVEPKQMHLPGQIYFSNTTATDFLKESVEKKHIKIISPFWKDIEQSKFQAEPLQWFDEREVNAYKTVDADECLNQRQLNLSAIEVNKSVVSSNEIISSNSKIQTTAIKRQTLLLIGTATFTACSFILSISNFYNDKLKDELKQQLLEQRNQNHALQNQVNQLMINQFKKTLLLKREK